MQIRRVLAVLLALALVTALGCSKQRANPSVKEQVEQALDQAGFKDIKVNEDRDKRELTLSGDVRSEELKDRAGDTAKTAAGDWVIANQVGVRPIGAESEAKKIDKNIDAAIEKNFKAVLIGNHLTDQHIRYNSTNGVLTLKGDVDSPEQRAGMEKLAASVPNVQQVVNELQVKGNKKHLAPRTTSKLEKPSAAITR